MSSGKERLCLESRRHGIVLLQPLGWAVVLAVAGGYGVVQGWPYDVAGAVALAVAALLALRAVWKWDRTKIVVTTERLSVVQGTLRRREASVRLDTVDAIELEQSILGRILGYGTLATGPLEVSHVPGPRAVCRLVESLSTDAAKREAEAAPAAPAWR